MAEPIARVEHQRVAIMGVRSWMVWRAVCDVHEGKEPLIPAWSSADLRDTWIGARIDAVLHDISEHEEPAGQVSERPSL